MIRETSIQMEGKFKKIKISPDFTDVMADFLDK